jgi:DNA-binding beta-propeller fold protein YncE
MAVDPHGNFAYVAVWGGHYVAKLDISALSSDRPVQDVLETVREVARIPVGGEVHPYTVALQPKSEQLWVANTQGTSVTIIDTNKDEVVATVELGSRGARAVAFSPDGSTAFVTIENVSQVAVVNTASLEVMNRIPVGPGRGASPWIRRA